MAAASALVALLALGEFGCGPSVSTGSGGEGAGGAGTTGTSTAVTGGGGAGGQAGAGGQVGTGGQAGAGGQGGAGGGGAECPIYLAQAGPSTVQHPDVAEASGIVESRKTAGILWVNNDSGDGPRIYAISTAGEEKGTFVLDGADAVDWEDIAIGPGPVDGETYLYVGDIGDNAESRNNIDIYLVAEPEIGPSPDTVTLSGVEKITLEYPDQPHNAETLLIDPVTSDLYVVVKSQDGVSPVFRAAAPLDLGGTQVLEQVTTLTFGEPPLFGNTTTTGGDISALGDAIAIRTYDHAYLWRRAPGVTIAEALSGAPCHLPLAFELQGESIGFMADGAGYYTLSEGTSEPLHVYKKQ